MRETEACLERAGTRRTLYRTSLEWMSMWMSSIPRFKYSNATDFQTGTFYVSQSSTRDVLTSEHGHHHNG